MSAIVIPLVVGLISPLLNIARESESQLTGKDGKDGLAFRALPEMRFLPIQKLRILTERLRLGLIEQAESFDVKSVRHGADLSTGVDGHTCL